MLIISVVKKILESAIKLGINKNIINKILDKIIYSKYILDKE